MSIPQSTAYTVMLKLYLSSDHVSNATSKTVAITISKAGGAFGNPNAGASNATEVANGWYKFALDTTDTGTLGDLVVRGTAASCDDTERLLPIVSATTGGATNLDAAVSSRMATYTQPTGFLAATFPSGTIASTTNITAGTIATVTTVTNQLTAAQIATGVWQDTTAGDFTVSSSIGKSLYTSGVVPGGNGGLFIAGTNAATTVTTSFTTTFTGNLTGSAGSVSGSVGSVTGSVGSVTGAVGSVTGNVGGNVVGSVASVTAAVTLSAGDSPVLQSGTAVGGGATTITLQTALGTTADPFGCLIKITSGTGASQERIITGYVNATKVTTVNYAWVTNPDATSVYSILYANTPKIDSSLKVSGVVLTDTVTTYTGNTLQTANVATLITTVGTAGVGLTNLGDTRIANLDATVSSRGTSTLTQTQVTGGGYSVQSALCVLGDARIAHLDVDVSSRMATYTQPSGFLSATFPTGTIANTTNITAGTIATVTNLTNAPTSGDLTSTMKTSVTTAATAATPTVAAVTGAVGSVTGSVGSVTGAVGSVTGSVGSVSGNVGGNVVGSVASVNAGVTVSANNDKTGYSLTNSSIVTATFGTCDFTTTMKSSIGIAVAASAVASVTADVGITQGGADKVWNTSTRILTASTNIALAKGTGLTGLNDLSQGDIRTATGLGAANLDTQLNAIYTVAELVQVKTDNLPSDPADESLIIAAFSALQSHGDSSWSTATGFALASSAPSWYVLPVDVSANVSAIKLKTDKLTFTTGNNVDCNILYVHNVQVTGTGASGNEWGPA